MSGRTTSNDGGVWTRWLCDVTIKPTPQPEFSARFCLSERTSHVRFHLPWLYSRVDDSLSGGWEAELCSPGGDRAGVDCSRDAGGCVLRLDGGLAVVDRRATAGRSQAALRSGRAGGGRNRSPEHKAGSRTCCSRARCRSSRADGDSACPFPRHIAGRSTGALFRGARSGGRPASRHLQ